MLDVFRRKAEDHGILSRCILHADYLDSLPPGDGFDAATAFLVSQFIQDRELRTVFFSSIANRLLPGGLLVSCDLATAGCPRLLEVWYKLMREGSIPDEGIKRMREADTWDVAVLPPRDVQDMIVHGGFEWPVLFFQAGMIHAGYAKRSASLAEQDAPTNGTLRRRCAGGALIGSPTSIVPIIVTVASRAQSFY